MGNQQRASAFPARYRVVKEYQASNPEPLAVQANETFQVSEKVSPWNENPEWLWTWCTDQRGKSAWVPTNIIELSPDGQSGITRQPYDAIELTVNIGDELQAEHEESGWYWCVDRRGQRGWVPIEHVEPLPSQPPVKS